MEFNSYLNQNMGEIMEIRNILVNNNKGEWRIRVKIHKEEIPRTNLLFSGIGELLQDEVLNKIGNNFIKK